MVPGVQPDVSLGFLRDSLSELLDYAHGAGVKVGVEYEPGLLIESAEQFIELKAAVNSPLLGVNLDLGHSRVLGEDPAATIQLLASHILHTHIEDIRGKRHYHLIPGTGDMDFAELFRLLAQSGYEGYLTVELYTYPDNPADAAEASIRHLAPILRGLSET
jgi:sugar phosphate isomerase/epimerase